MLLAQTPPVNTSIDQERCVLQHSQHRSWKWDYETIDSNFESSGLRNAGVICPTSHKWKTSIEIWRAHLPIIFSRTSIANHGTSSRFLQGLESSKAFSATPHSFPSDAAVHGRVSACCGEAYCGDVEKLLPCVISDSAHTPNRSRHQHPHPIRLPPAQPPPQRAYPTLQWAPVCTTGPHACPASGSHPQ
jgi:hypothetical protein